MEAGGVRFIPTFLWVLAESRGIDTAKCLTEASLSANINANSVVTIEQHFAFARCVVASLGVEDKPFLMANLLWDVGAEAMTVFRANDNFSQMLHNFSRYARILGVADASFAQDDSTCTITQHVNADMSIACLAFANLINLVRLGQQVTQQQIVPLAGTFAFDWDKSDVPSPFAANTPFTKGSMNSLTFAKADAEIPFLTADGNMLDGIKMELDRRLRDLGGDDEMLVQMRMAILRGLPEGNANLAAVAKSIGVGARTLQRRLHAVATSFSQELDDVRRVQTMRYLTEGRLAKSEISFRVGYGDLNSFYRALARWRDMPRPD
ncbi:hypothetical protein N9W44_04520 [Alphaproteobacteria bacterium]|jgi:AraC-like DNA-binding protein|nr:hypothetical protein [Alphaproteobacteria bacterium]